MTVIIKYNAGNIKSVENALLRLNTDCIVSDDPEVIRRAGKVIFPGVGEARSAMKYLRENDLDRVIKNLTQPVLGICLGQQLMCAHSEENDTACLGIFDVKVKKFPPGDKVPHIGWNNITNLKSPIFEDVEEASDCYFVHSYYADISTATTAVCDYILPFSAALKKDNFYATQFHPEKSAGIGEQILKNFLKL